MDGREEGERFRRQARRPCRRRATRVHIVFQEAAPRRTVVCVTVIVKTACERLLVAFMLVLAVARCLPPSASQPV